MSTAMNKGMEELLRERSAQLEASVKELEAFSYAVSHELRAPIRTMAGYSNLLKTRHAASLDREGQEYVDKLYQVALQMDEMVKALLAFSRLGSKELFPHPVKPADLARQALEEHAGDMEGRNLEVIIGDLPECRAVPALLRQVYSILFSNAIKYTRRREKAVIEAGFLPDEREGSYFVKDNGAGFPPGEKERLFILFKRFHGNEEFEGLGVGLALAQRIINRLGGEIRAEGDIEKGATIFFTLPQHSGIN